MADSAEPQASPRSEQPGLHYSAFISYNSRDTLFVRRLHKRLETYRVPGRLAASSPTVVSRTHRIKPIFRDNLELSAAYDLTTAVREAIAQSDYLIVVCSPHSANSEWVGREIELFRTLHGDNHILAALIDGTPQTAFPPALHGRRPADAFEPLAADFRPGASGQKLAFLKLIAALIGVPLDELLQRDSQRQLRQIAAVAVGGVAGIAVVAGLAVAALNARADAALQRNRAGGLGDFMTTDLRKGLEEAGRHDLLDQVNRAALDSYKSENLSRLTPEQLVQRAKLLQGMGKDAEKRGELTKAHEQFEAAHKTTAALLAAKPDDPKRLFAHAQSEYWIGFINWREGDARRAKAGFESYAELADRLVAADPLNDDWRMETVYGAHNLGMLALRQAGDPARADRYFHVALKRLETIVLHKPSDPEVLTERATLLAWLADSQRLQGHLVEARATREAQRRTLEDLLAKNPRNVEVKRHLLANDLGLARIAAAEGASDRAIPMFEAGYAKALILEAQDPDNKDYPKQARMFELFEADLWLKLPRHKRPPATVIAAKIGDCAPLGPGADNQEISDFCGVLLARFRSQQGDRAGAAAALAPVRQHAAARHDVLTARWGLNLAAEARPIQLAEGGLK